MQNKKKHISFILIAVLILTGLFSYQNTAYGTTTYTTYETKTYYRLDTGVTFLWKNSAGKWQYDRSPGSKDTFKTSMAIPANAEKVTAIAYNEEATYGGAGYFPFKSENGISNDQIIWNKTTIADNKDDYDTYYNSFAANPLSMGYDYTKSTGKLGLTYNVTFNAFKGKAYDVKDKLANGLKQEVIDLLGSPSEGEIEAMDLMNPQSENYSSSVEGYLYFFPVVIKYDIVEAVQHTISGFEPHLDVPTSAKAGEEFTVTDTTEFEDEAEFGETTLSYRVDGGSSVEVKDWDGTFLGSKINQTFDDVCTVEYTLTAWNNRSESKTATKTINITDNREITVNADLELPEYTYEGHTELARDVSTFTVDGVDYSATRAYSKGIADNSFKCASSTVSIDKLTDTKANATFSEKGTYSVNLKIKTITGGSAADTESIEVRKTPCIVDTLSGFQKQNRKQILNAVVATYPGKPLTDYSVTLKDKVTGNSVTLTPDHPQVNNRTIKTRSVTMTQDIEEGFAYITVEFLTKTPAYNLADTDYSQQFYYEINVEDSKGDTDLASKYFDVTPDIPPTAAISLDSAFLRNEGTNIASITAEDVTVATDGDDVARTWYYGATTSPSVFTNVSTMDGYEKQSFGTDKIVGFNKVGVGKFTTKLSVKEVWTEPTLEEYVTDAEHLTGTAISCSDVQNVAPIVSLELLNSTEQEILLLANSDAEYQTLLNKKTELQKSLLQNKIDGQIIIKKLVGNTPSTVTGVSTQYNAIYPYGYNNKREDNILAVDSEQTYLLTYMWIGAGESETATLPKTIHAINPYSGGEDWAYTTSRDEDFTFGQDDTGKYLYLIYANSNQTVLLDKRTGAEAGTIKMALSDKIWLSNNLAFVVQNSNLYAIDLNSLTKVLVDESVSAVSRVNGKLQYITKSNSGVLRNNLDMETLECKKQMLIDTSTGSDSSSDYIAVCIDSTGKVVLWKNTGIDSFRGAMTITADNKVAAKVAIGARQSDPSELHYAMDEKGQCNYIIEREYETSGTDTYSTIGINLNTRATALYSSHSTNFQAISYQGAFESNGRAYFLFSGEDSYFSSGGVAGAASSYTPAYCFQISGSSCSFSLYGAGIGALDENMKVSDRFAVTIDGENELGDGELYFRIIAFPRTLAQEMAEVVSRFTNKLTFVGDVNTTADEIKTVAEAPRPTIKVTATNNGYLTLSNQSLVPNKKYYYEYEIKPLTDGTVSKLNGITTTTGSTTSDQSFLSDTLYVNESHEEDFNNGTVDDYFTVVDPGAFRNGMYGAYYNGSKDNDSAMSMTFDVPSGKQAIVSFDYSFYFYASSYSGTNIFIDGNRMDEKSTISADADSSYTRATGSKIFYKLLSSGTHTIEIRVSARSGNWSQVLLDNLRVDLLSNTPNSSSDSYQVSENGEWKDFSGSFKTPNRIISYGGQASSHYYGGLPSQVTETYYYKRNYYPEKIEYYQTVPTGYLQKGSVHIMTNTYLTRYERVKYIINGVGTVTREVKTDGSPFIVNEWIPLEAPKSEGSYTHTVDIKSPEDYQGYMDIFDLVTYPSNAVTLTGNMAFNDSLTEYYFPKVSSNKLTNLSIYLPKGEYLIKNLKMYYMENGRKIYLQNEDLEELTDLSNWTLSTGLTSSIVTEEEEEVDDEYVKVYKKGEKVLYNIYYSDYEEDPSKTGYWVYTHVNWPPDTVHSDAGKVLTAPIDRFYLSGKYTVTHWEVDNTQRTGTVGDASSYDAASNKVTMTFYVDGEGKAPWVEYIKTNPSSVKENNSYTIKVGVDDTEKDTLALETEVYLNGTLVKTDNKVGLAAGSDGDYPEQTITGLSTAKVGVYQIICTVSDYSGTGIKSYKFTVTSEGKITGAVNHTDEWDANRKKYNLERFEEEVNRAMVFNDYEVMATPRKRGTNVFWSGEKFILRAETEGEPSKVTANIMTMDSKGNYISTGYSAQLSSTGKKTTSGAELWEGSLWDNSMINKWGRENPEQLFFKFTAYYSGGLTKTYIVSVIIDSDVDYWQLHRLW